MPSQYGVTVITKTVSVRGGIDGIFGIDGLGLELDHGNKGFDRLGAGHGLDSD